VAAAGGAITPASRPPTDAVVYLITHTDLRAAKIGITDSSGSRLKTHSTRGWQVLCSVTVLGERALLIEAEILEWWRGELALPAYLGPQEMKQCGSTETVSAEDIDRALTIRLIWHLAEAPQTPVMKPCRARVSYRAHVVRVGSG
jgi:hypothetical protein